MSNLIVLTFDDTEQAGQAYDALKQAKHDGHVKIDDAAVIVKQVDGKVEVKNKTDAGVKWGAIGGGMLGLILASVFFPIAGLAIGAAGGALVGKTLNLGVDKKFVRDVTETLKPGMSALFVLGRDAHPDVIAATLRPFHGTIYQTTLDSEAVEVLSDALKKE